MTLTPFSAAEQSEAEIFNHLMRDPKLVYAPHQSLNGHKRRKATGISLESKLVSQIPVEWFVCIVFEASVL